VLRLFFNGFRIGQLAMVVIGNIQDPWWSVIYTPSSHLFAWERNLRRNIDL
jgi:hypothetical protein